MQQAAQMSSPLIFVADGRVLPYIPVTAAALEAIREACPRRRPYATATYMALLEIANEYRAQRVAVSQKEIVDRVGASRSTVQAALADLQTAHVLEVFERHHGAARVENEYVIIEPSQVGDESCTLTRVAGNLARDTGSSEKDQEPQRKREEGNARAKVDEVPPDFPDELRPHARAVMTVLKSMAERHNAKAVSAHALGLVIMARPKHPLIRAAHDCAAHFDPVGRRRKDVVATYRNWLDRCAPLASTELLPGAEPAGPTAVVTSLHGRRDPEAERQARQARRAAQAMREPQYDRLLEAGS